jgi:hypothetical protein
VILLALSITQFSYSSDTQSTLTSGSGGRVVDGKLQGPFLFDDSGRTISYGNLSSSTDLHRLQDQWISANSARVAFSCVGILVCVYGLRCFSIYQIFTSRSSAGFVATANAISKLFYLMMILTLAHFGIGVADSLIVASGSAKCRMACLRDCNRLQSPMELGACHAMECSCGYTITEGGVGEVQVITLQTSMGGTFRIASLVHGYASLPIPSSAPSPVFHDLLAASPLTNMSITCPPTLAPTPTPSAPPATAPTAAEAAATGIECPSIQPNVSPLYSPHLLPPPLLAAPIASKCRCCDVCIALLFSYARFPHSVLVPPRSALSTAR